MHKKLRRKFVCILMSVVTVLLCLVFGLVIYFTGERMEQESREALQRAMLEPGFPGSFTGNEMLPYFVISRDPVGNLRASGTVYLEGYPEETLRDFYELAVSGSAQNGALREYDLLYLRDGSRVVFLDVSSQRLAMESLTQVCVTVGLLSFGLLLGVSILLAKWAVRPVETAWDRQRKFIADASHELKTPLTVIMTNAELLQEGANTQEARNILTMSRHMRTLVEGMLELARVDDGAVKQRMQPLDLSSLFAETLLPFEPMFFERELLLEDRLQPELRVRGDAAYLRQVLEILLDNAMKYSDPGKVYVVLQRKGDRAELAVANPGHIPEEKLPHLFERFYRGDEARSRDGSYGLGLAIARSILREHGGTVTAENDGAWAVFRVSLPLLP